MHVVGVLTKSNHGSSSAAPKNPYSQKLRDDLDAINLAALQNAMLDQPDLLLDLLAFQLTGMTGYNKVFDVNFGTPADGRGFKFPVEDVVLYLRNAQD